MNIKISKNEILFVCFDIDFDTARLYNYIKTNNGRRMKDVIKFCPYHNDDSAVNYNLMIVRVSPEKNGVILEWVGKTTGDFTVQIYRNKNLIVEMRSDKNEIEIDNLKSNTEYSAVIRADNQASDRRLFVTGDYLYPVVNYYNPKDRVYDFSGNFLGSPHIVRFHEKLFCTMDTFKNGGTASGHKQSIVFISDDDGKKWRYLSEIVPAEWGRFIIVKDELYFIGTKVGEGVIFYKTTDGITFEKGDVISPEYDGKDVYFCSSPTHILVKGDYVYFVGGAPYYIDGVAYSSLTMAKGNVKTGLLNKKSWTFSNTLYPDPAWNIDAENHRYAEESNVVERNGEIYVISRYFTNKALMTRYDKENNKLEFYKIIDLEIGYCKFYIEKNEEDGYYYAMGNHRCFPRQILKLYRSKDLENWEYVKTIKDITETDKNLNGIQYPSFIIENNVAITVIRTALNGSENFHNSNAVTFAKINLYR